MKDSMDWTQEQVFEEVKGQPERPDCLMVIALWNENGKYDTKFWNVGLKVSDMVSLLEIQKAKLIKYMEDESYGCQHR